MDFEKFIKGLAERAMEEGLVSVDDIKNLCASVSKDAYDRGYAKGNKDGYSQAVADIDKERN